MIGWGDWCDRAERAQEHGDGVFDDRVGVGFGCMDDGDASGFAGVEVDVVEPDTRAGNDAEVGGLVEEGLVDDGVGANDQGVGLREA